MKTRIQDGHWLIKTACAHRGLHGNGIPENSVSAYKKAIENGYPIEMDVQLTSDLIPVCFHDDNLKRITGKDALIWNTSFQEVSSLNILDTDEKIITFEEFLKLVSGQVPLLIELKSQPKNNQILAQKVLEILKDYKGEYVIQSFDPRLMKFIRKLDPKVIRGQLIDGGKTAINPVLRFILSNGLLNFMSKPDFINYSFQKLPLKNRIARGKRVLCWTIRTQKEEEFCLPFVEGYVFENITPKLK